MDPVANDRLTPLTEILFAKVSLNTGKQADIVYNPKCRYFQHNIKSELDIHQSVKIVVKTFWNAPGEIGYVEPDFTIPHAYISKSKSGETRKKVTFSRVVGMPNLLESDLKNKKNELFGRYFGSPVCIKNVRDFISGGAFEKYIKISQELDHPNIQKFLGAYCHVSERKEFQGTSYTWRYKYFIEDPINEDGSRPLLRHYLDRHGSMLGKHLLKVAIGVGRALSYYTELSKKYSLVNYNITSYKVIFSGSEVKIMDVCHSILPKDEQMSGNHFEESGDILNWRSPESLLRNQKNCEVYSFAKLLEEMVTGKMPYGGCSLSTLQSKIPNAYITPEYSRLDCPEELGLIIKAGLKPIDERPSIDRMVGALEVYERTSRARLVAKEFFAFTLDSPLAIENEPHISKLNLDICRMIQLTDSDFINFGSTNKENFKEFLGGTGHYWEYLAKKYDFRLDGSMDRLSVKRRILTSLHRFPLGVVDLLRKRVCIYEDPQNPGNADKIRKMAECLDSVHYFEHTMDKYTVRLLHRNEQNKIEEIIFTPGKGQESQPSDQINNYMAIKKKKTKLVQERWVLPR